MPLWKSILSITKPRPFAGEARVKSGLLSAESVKFYIIILIYNVQDYLAHYLDSILAQSYTNFEAILVNDGSMDKSGEMATQYAQKDSRLTLVHQDNQGLSNARNIAFRVIKDKELSHM